MAISTYSELVTAVTNHIHRNDLTSVIPDFITLAEDELNARCRLPCQETFDDLSVTSRLTALPSDLIELRSVEYDGSPLQLVPFGTPEYLTAVQYDNASGAPRWYSIRANQLEVFPYGTLTLNLTYYAKVGPLTSNTPTTAVLTNHPSLYFYGTLRQAAIYTRDADLGAAAATMFDNALELAKAAGKRKQFPGPLAVKVA